MPALHGKERGAAAVEMALVLPVLILLLLGIMEFGRAYNAQVTLTSAARESVRVMAIGKNDASARQTAITAAATLNPSLNDSNILITRTPTAAVNTCESTSTITRTVTVDITYSLSTLTGIAGPFTLKGKGVMLCGG